MLDVLVSVFKKSLLVREFGVVVLIWVALVALALLTSKGRDKEIVTAELFFLFCVFGVVVVLSPISLIAKIVLVCCVVVIGILVIRKVSKSVIKNSSTR